MFGQRDQLDLWHPSWFNQPKSVSKYLLTTTYAYYKGLSTLFRTVLLILLPKLMFCVPVESFRRNVVSLHKWGLLDGPSCDNSITFHSSSIYMQYKLLTTFKLMMSLGYRNVILKEFASRLEVLMSLLESKPIYTHR